MTDTIIIDTDPGVDDALALAYCASAGLPVKAITTVYGNVDVASSTNNAAYIVKSLGAGWKLYKGAMKPIMGKGHLATSHGSSGIGDVAPKQGEMITTQAISVADYFETLAQSDEIITLFCLGPLTNIAEAMMKSPGILQHIRKIIMTGGAFTERGNVTEFAEFNVYNDPFAMQVVLDKAAEAWVDVVIIPVEVCRKLILTEDDLLGIEARSVLPNIRAIVTPYLDHYLHHATDGKHAGAVLYDVLVPLYYHHPELFTVQGARVEVIQKGPQYGQTLAIEQLDSVVKVCTSVDVAQVKKRVLQALRRTTTS
jgi:purine nucleosidase